MAVLSIISGLLGSGSAIVQNVLEKRDERKTQEINLKYQKETDIRIAEIQAKTESSNAHESTKQANLHKQIEELKSESNRYEAIVKTSAYLDKMEYKSVRIANFIIALTRPLVTFILLLLTIILSTTMDIDEIFALENTFATLDYILAYWFVRRSIEKKKT